MSSTELFPPPINRPNDPPTTASETLKTILPEALTSLNPPADVYFVDQLKNGLVVNKQPIVKNRIIFGRARDCDIILEHPSISRYHAAMLWCPKNDDNYVKGFISICFIDFLSINKIFLLFRYQ